MLFELPHFALELLVVLPCAQASCDQRAALLRAAFLRTAFLGMLHVYRMLPTGHAIHMTSPIKLPHTHAARNLQILCSRLRVMAQPHVREPAGEAADAAVPAPAAAAAGDAAGPPPAEAEEAAAAGGWVPDVMRRRWRRDPAQRRLLPRLRANLRAMAMITAVLAGVRMCVCVLSFCWGIATQTDSHYVAVVRRLAEFALLHPCPANLPMQWLRPTACGSLWLWSAAPPPPSGVHPPLQALPMPLLCCFWPRCCHSCAGIWAPRHPAPCGHSSLRQWGHPPSAICWLQG